MIRMERMDKIMEILKEKKHVTVDYLSKSIFASAVTIRRDLKTMETMGLIVKSYGGVSLLEYENKTVPLHLREIERRAEKDAIARQAVSLLREGQTIFIDASSTALRMANHIKSGMKITVITNSIRVVMALCEKDITVYCTGGLLLNQSIACVGPYTIKMLESVNVDAMFFSAQGLTENGIITDSSESETSLRQSILRRSRHKYFLCDSGKLGKSFLFTMCSTRDVDKVICDQNINAFLKLSSYK